MQIDTARSRVVSVAPSFSKRDLMMLTDDEQTAELGAKVSKVSTMKNMRNGHKKHKSTSSSNASMLLQNMLKQKSKALDSQNMDKYKQVFGNTTSFNSARVRTNDDIKIEN